MGRYLIGSTKVCNGVMKYRAFKARNVITIGLCSQLYHTNNFFRVWRKRLLCSIYFTAADEFFWVI